MTQYSYQVQTRRPLNWKLAAEMLAAGCTTAQVAHQIGTTRQNVWRVMKDSDVFRKRLAATRKRAVVEAGSAIDGLRGEVAETIKNQVLEGNIRVTLWLADRLGLAGITYPEVRSENDSDPDAELVLDDAVEIARPEIPPSTSTDESGENQGHDLLTVNSRQQPSTAPDAASASISAGEYPSSPSTSDVCSPSSGACRVTDAGVAENLTGGPSVATRPSSG